MMASNPINSMNLTALKDELRSYGAKVSGRKQELCERLQFYRSNKTVVPLEPEYKMKLPDTSHYKDVHNGMLRGFPKINMSRLEEYLHQFKKSWDSKITDFYKQRFLRFLRAAAGEPSGSIYLTSVVWAEMKKSVSYKVDVLVEGSGVISEAQCECGAGQGPGAHCKHVCTVLYGAIQFIKDEEILTEVTCTQVLQTFHHAKPHKGSPLKLTGIRVPRKKEKSGSQAAMGFRYDPRRSCDRNRETYKSEFRNVCLNFQANLGGSMPVMQLFPPANLHGVVMDHDYLRYDAAYQFLLDQKLISIEKEDIDNIEASTRGQARNNKWRKARAFRITASNFGKISKGTDRQNKTRLAISLLSSSELRNEAVLHGVRYEPVAIEHYEDVSNNITTECGLFVSKQTPILAASPDRVVNSNLIVEVKCPYSARNKDISPQTVPYLTNNSNNLTLKTNHDYYYQIQGQLYCSERPACDLVVYTIKDIKIIRIEADNQFIQDMVGKLMDFHENYHKSALISKHVYKDYYNYKF